MAMRLVYITTDRVTSYTVLISPLSLSFSLQDQVLNATDQPSSPSRPHSSSTPSLPQVSPTGSSSDFERSWRSQSFSVSRPVPIRPRQLHLSEPNSVPSSPTTRGRSMSSSLVTIGAAAFGLALMHYLQS